MVGGPPRLVLAPPGMLSGVEHWPAATHQRSPVWPFSRMTWRLATSTTSGVPSPSKSATAGYPSFPAATQNGVTVADASTPVDAGVHAT